MTSRHLLLALLLATSPATAATTREPGPRATAFHPVVPFIQDDYTRAVAEARARKVPLFIEAWAPW